MAAPDSAVPDHTAMRTALWRTMHVEADAAPPVFDDGAGPEDGWPEALLVATTS